MIDLTTTTEQGHANLEIALQDLPQLLAHSIGRILNLQGTTLGHNLLSSEGPLGVSPSGVLPPLLDGLDIVQILPVFFFKGSHDDDVWYSRRGNISKDLD